MGSENTSASYLLPRKPCAGSDIDLEPRPSAFGLRSPNSSPLTSRAAAPKCTTSEIRAGARAGVAFSSSRAARSLSGTARIRSYVVGDTKIVNCRFQSLLKSIESDPSANRLASNFRATPAPSSSNFRCVPCPLAGGDYTCYCTRVKASLHVEIQSIR